MKFETILKSEHEYFFICQTKLFFDALVLAYLIRNYVIDCKEWNWRRQKLSTTNLRIWGVMKLEK